MFSDEKTEEQTERVTESPDLSKDQNPIYHSTHFHHITHFLRLLWLFTESDVPTFVLPDTAFGIFGALSGALLTTNAAPDNFGILRRTPLVALYVWTNLLVFDLANQRLPESIVEDRFNKPWRPLPSGLITPVQTRRLNLAVLPLFFAISYALNVWRETAILFVLTWMYNDLKGGDEDFIVRNLIIAFAFGFYNEGAMRVAGGASHEPNSTGLVWTAIVSAIIFSTMHTQDMKDQVGDAAKGRRSAPIVLGDWIARWTVVVPVVFWSVFCPIWWNIPLALWALPIGLGSVIAVRQLWLRDPKADHITWVIWAVWLCLIYLLPVVRRYAPELS